MPWAGSASANRSPHLARLVGRGASHLLAVAATAILLGACGQVPSQMAGTLGTDGEAPRARGSAARTTAQEPARARSESASGRGTLGAGAPAPEGASARPAGGQAPEATSALATAADAAPTFSATATVEITPDLAGAPNLCVAGWAAPDPASCSATGRDSPLLARALAIREGTAAPKVLVSADVVAFPRPVFAAVLDLVRKERPGFPEENLLLVGTHTHQGPVLPAQPDLRVTYGYPAERDAGVDAYAAWLQTRLAALVLEVVGAAERSSHAVSLEFGLSRAHLGRNRAVAWTGPGVGPTDPDLPVLVVRSADDSVNAVVFSYALHAVTQNARRWFWDYPGEAMEQVRQALPGRPTVLFLPGAGADLDPAPGDTAASLGAKLKEAALRVVNREAGTGTAAVGARITARTGAAALPLDLRVSRSALRGLYEGRRQDASRSRAERAHAAIMVERIDRGTLASSVPLRISTWTFGDSPGPSLTLVALSGEPVVDLGLALKRVFGADRNVWLVGYTNGHEGYLPTDEMIRLRELGFFGSYEAGWGTSTGGQRLPDTHSAPLYNDGWPAPLQEGAEASICTAVGALLGVSGSCAGLPLPRLRRAPRAWQPAVALSASPEGGGPPTLSTFVVDAQPGGGCLHGRDWTGAGMGASVGSWSPWSPDPGCGGFVDRPAVVSWRDGSDRARLDVVVRDARDTLWHRACVGTASGCSSSGWRPWVAISAAPVADTRSPALTVWKQTNGVPRLELFVRKSDGCLWQMRWTGSGAAGESGTWSPWTRDPGCRTSTFRSAPAAVSWRDGTGTMHHQVLAVEDSTSSLWTRTCVGSDARCAWQPWTEVGRVTDVGPNPDPAAVAWVAPDGTPQVEVFVQRMNGGLVCYGSRAWVGPGRGTWGAWRLEPGCGGLASPPAAAAWRDGLGRPRLDVIGVDAAGDPWHRSRIGAAAGAWSGWMKLSDARGGF